MKHLLTKINFKLILALFALVTFVACSDDDDTTDPTPEGPTPTGTSTTYELKEMAVEGISGTAKFIENTDASITVELKLSGTPQDGQHPAHIHVNTAAEGGGIAITLGTVDGNTGASTITFSAQDDGSSITYAQLIDFDGYINVHLSATELGTIVAQGDIGQNELTGTSKEYALGEKAVAGISGTATFYERVNGEALAILSLTGTPAGGEHPAHIHLNTAAEGGSIAFSFNPVNGTTGLSATNVAALDNSDAFQYADVLTFDGYINVHLSASELGTIVAQGDIGQNELTGMSKEYALGEKAVAGISGTATFYERANGEALAILSLTGTPAGGEHPAHIHLNTAAEGGSIAFSFNPVNGTTGLSATNVAALDNSDAFQYADVLTYDGYINVHLSATELGTIVAQGDIGQNELTGTSKEYALGEKAVAGISGTATFYERVNGEALAILSLTGTPEGGEHPAHIHNGEASVGGGIAFTFNPVNGTTGSSATNVAALNNSDAFLYADVLTFDGYINVHLSATELSTIVAQGNIGANEGSTGSRVTYTVTNSGASAYVFNGEGLTDASNPDLTLKRGMTYDFNVNTPGHPFLIKTTQTTGTADAYSNGITNGGATSGVVSFTVPQDAPATLFYICEFHGSMTGTLNIVD